VVKTIFCGLRPVSRKDYRPRPQQTNLRGFIELSLGNEPLRGLFLLFICHRWIQMHTDAVAGIVVIYTYRDRIGLVQALACHPLRRMCSLSQDLLFKWRTELIKEEAPIERRPLLRSPAQYFNRYQIPIISHGNNRPNAKSIIKNPRPARAGLLFYAFQNNKG